MTRQFARTVFQQARPLLACLLLTLPAGASLACTAPAFTHQIPNGKTASEEEMATAQQAVKAFVSAGESFVACLEKDGSVSGSAASRQTNATIDQMQQVAAQFNRELRNFRKR